MNDNLMVVEWMMHQLNLPFQYDKDTLRDYLERLTGKPISLRVTDNSTSLLSIRPGKDLISVRMHWMFLKAGNDVIRDLADFILRRKGPSPHLRQFINEHRDCITVRDAGCRSTAAIRTQGRFHDLDSMFRELNDTYFGGRITASISWGTRTAKRRVRRRTLGSFSQHTNTIWISPLLDRRRVPDFFIRFIVYHEMLHSIMGEEKHNGRRRIHSAAFREQERSFRDYEKAVVWEKKHFAGAARGAYQRG